MSDAKSTSKTATVKPGTRRNSEPTLVGTVEAFPVQSRDGFWQKQYKLWQERPGEIFQYDNASTTATTTIKRQFGAEARSSKAHKGDNGSEVCTVYVRYDPERVDEVKAEVQRRGEARRAAAAAKAQK